MLIKNRLDKQLYEVFYKIKKGEKLTRILFKAIDQFILKFSIFYDINKISFLDFMKTIKQTQIYLFTIMKDNVKYTTLKEIKKRSTIKRR